MVGKAYFQRIFITISTGISLFLFACKKEYPADPYNSIQSFRISDATGTSLYAAIDNDRIIVYWPPLQTAPDSITPSISVSDRAVITPASGVKVPFKEGITYTVRAEDGSTQTFTLHPIINQPPISVSGVTLLSGAYPQIAISCRMDGQYFIADTLRTAVYVVKPGANGGTGGTETVKAVIHIINSSSIYFTVQVADTGVYAVKLISGLQTVMAQNITVTLPPPQLIFPAGESVQRGGSLTLSGQYLGNISSVVTYDDSFNGPYPLTIIAQTATSITVQFPATLTPGEYIDLSVERNGDGMYYDFYVDPGSGVTVH